MKRNTCLLLLFFATLIMSQNLKEYRLLIHSSKDSEKATKTLIEKSTKSFNLTKEPIFAGFIAVGDFFMAKHAFNPLKKISHFNHGKKMLEMALKAEPKNIELRLMRLMAQENIPKILGYHHDIQEDRNMILKEYKNEDDLDLKNFIIEYLKL